MKAKISLVAQRGPEELYLIVLPLDLTGFDCFLTSWLVRGGQGDVLVDCGPASVAPNLAQALEELKSTPKVLMLTHIHMDHAGGAGALCRKFPDLKVHCFEKAARHLIDPAKLWTATAATLGEATAQAYQEPLPVPAERFITTGQVPQGWQVLETPGHAPHHLSFLVDWAGRRLCFGGEALGVLAGGGEWFADGRARPFMRPATPPKYYPETGRASMELLGRQDWDLFCAAHCGALEDQDLVPRAIKQLEFWQENISRWLGQSLEEGEMVERLIAEDPELVHFKDLSEPCRQRERYFLGNSVAGLVQHFRSSQ